MRIALDVQLRHIIGKLQDLGHEVVVCAHEGEADEDWVIRAMNDDAEVFISPDLDIPNILDKMGSEAHWIDIPQGKSDVVRVIQRAIKRFKVKEKSSG